MQPEKGVPYKYLPPGPPNIRLETANDPGLALQGGLQIECPMLLFQVWICWWGPLPSDSESPDPAHQVWGRPWDLCVRLPRDSGWSPQPHLKNQYVEVKPGAEKTRGLAKTGTLLSLSSESPTLQEEHSLILVTSSVSGHPDVWDAQDKSKSGGPMRVPITKKLLIKITSC